MLIVLVHHRNKSATDAPNATGGSSAIAGGVDAAVTLDLSEESDGSLTPDQTLTMRVEGRYGPRQRLVARLPSGLRWEPVDPFDSADLSVGQRILRRLEVDMDA